MGVDYVELVNVRTVDTASIPFTTLSGGPLGILAGTDMHQPSVNYAWMVMQVEFEAGEVASLSDSAEVKKQKMERRQERVMNVLRRRKTSVIVDTVGTPFFVFSEQLTTAYEFASFWIGIGEWATQMITFRQGMTSFLGPRCSQDVITVNWRIVGWYMFHFIFLFVLLQAFFFLLSRVKNIFFPSK